MKNVSVQTLDDMRDLKLKLKSCTSSETAEIICQLSDDEKDVLIMMYAQDSRDNDN